MERNYCLAIFVVTVLAIGIVIPTVSAVSGKKRILIHVPVQVKNHHHVHTVYKHIVHEHDHQHQHHGEEPPAESEEALSGEYPSGSNADYKVLGYTYGNDAEPLILEPHASNSDEQRETRGYHEVDSVPHRSRKPQHHQTSQRYRDRYRHVDGDDDDGDDNSGRDSHRGYQRYKRGRGTYHKGYRQGGGHSSHGHDVDSGSQEVEHSDESWEAER